MAHVGHHFRSRTRLAHLGEPVGTHGHDPLLRHLSARSTKRSDGLANESPLYGWPLFRGFAGVMAGRVRHSERLQLRQRGGGDSTVDLHPVRTFGLPRIPGMGNAVHGLVRLGLCGFVTLGLSACAQWTPGWLEKPKAIAPAPVENITYAAQPRLGGAWQYRQPQPGLVHLIGKRMPAIVNTPTPWPYVPRLSEIRQETMPFPERRQFQIPKAWFQAGANEKKTVKVNPWHCQPAKLPCGKVGTAYWACNKAEKGIASKENQP